MIFLFFVFLFDSIRAQAQEPGSDLVQRGQYIFSLAGGCACHTAPKGTPNVGARESPIPMAKIYSTNLTADKETGLGDWSDQQIRDALTKGIRPNGEKLLPVMPYEAYSGMSEEDLKALIAYLRSLKPVRKETAALKTWAPLYRAGGTFVWFQFFSRFSNFPAKAPQSGIERGRYLVEHVALCIAQNRISIKRKALWPRSSRPASKTSSVRTRLRSPTISNLSRRLRIKLNDSRRIVLADVGDRSASP